MYFLNIRNYLLSIIRAGLRDLIKGEISVLWERSEGKDRKDEDLRYCLFKGNVCRTTKDYHV